MEPTFSAARCTASASVMSIMRGTKPSPNSLCKRSASACLRTEPNTRNPFETSTFVVPQPIPVDTPVTTTSLLFAIAFLLRRSVSIFNMCTVHLRCCMCQGVQCSHALSVENRPPDHPFGRAEAAGARGYPRLVVTQSRGLPRSRAQCNLPLLFRSLSTGSCVSGRSGPANGTGAEEGSRRARAGCRNPRDVICLHQVREGQPSPLRRDDESPRAEARCDPPPKPVDVHS